MSAQEALWAEPEWTSAYEVGTRVRNRHTDATGTVVAVEPGVRLSIRWDSPPSWVGYECTHASGLGLEVLA